MDWLLINPQISSLFSSLGSLQGDTYVVNPNTLAILDEINYKLTYEDQTLRTFRRAIGFGQNVRVDLIPLLKNTRDEKILDSVIRLLVNLTIPVECLFSVDVMYRTEVGRQTIYDINNLLHMCKEAFTDPKSTKSIVEFMKHILESDLKLSPKKCDQINNCLLLLRNVLHIPEMNMNTFLLPSTSSSISNHLVHNQIISVQNIILWNLFIQSIDKLLLYLMTCSQRSYWGASIVQLIALIYKDQHVSTLQRLLNIWFEASLSESSEDNESNTSPPKQGSGESSPMLTSDPTSDSSDNGSGSNNGGGDGGGTGNNITSEDRRQALRNETEATLQEVSRKGQEYQDSILHAVGDKAYYSQESNEVQQPVNQITNTTTSSITSRSNMFKDADIFLPPLPAAQLPVKASSSNTNDKNELNSSSIQQDALKSTTTVPTTGLKVCQKSPHSGRLNLTKSSCCPQKRGCPSSQSELSDCGYGTQVENQESISTSSNDDEIAPQHHAPSCSTKGRNKQRISLTASDKKELRRKKLVKRSKSSLINMKGLVQHIPTDDDISNLLKEFTVDFLLKGYAYLVQELHSQLIANLIIPIDTSHFFWLLTYFLKFAAQLELDLEHINTILTYDVISYLTYEGVTLTEQLELNSRQEGTDLKPYLRRIHLVVTAIREFLQAIETYKKVTHLSETDRDYLKCLQLQISNSEDIRNLFVLLLRSFKPTLHTKQYLQDLIITNHILLLLIDAVNKTDENNLNINRMEHISQFATLEIMHYYGILLEDFYKNGKYVNDCIFTMMHHIAGDLGQIGTLFQPIILKTFSRAWESDYELCDDWSDLIEYIIHKFMNTPQNTPIVLPTTSLNALTKENKMGTTYCFWTQEENDTLYWYYVQSKKHEDIVGKIVKLFSNNGNKHKSRISIIQQLLQQDIITLVEYDDLMKFEDAKYQRTLLTTPSSGTTESGVELKDNSSNAKPSDDIQVLRDLIIKDKREKHLRWLQKYLLECCCIKLILRDNALKKGSNQHLKYVMEPVAFHSILKNKPVPIVQWNNDQAIMMLYQPFVLLLHKLGFQLPVDAGSVFARIPDYWSAEMMYTLAKKLGPLDKLLIKFHLNQLEAISDLDNSIFSCQYPRASFSSTSSLEVEVNDVDELTSINTTTSPMAKVEFSSNKFINSEIFAVPKAKQCNSFFRFTPDITSTQPTTPSWLQLVMRSKCPNTVLKNDNSVILHSDITPIKDEKDDGHSINKNLSATTDLLLIDKATITATTKTSISDIYVAPPSTVTYNNAIAIATGITETTVAAPRKIDHVQNQPMTLLPCPSINNIIDVQGESNKCDGNRATATTTTNTTATTATISVTKKLFNGSLKGNILGIIITTAEINTTTTTTVITEAKSYNGIGSSLPAQTTTTGITIEEAVLSCINEKAQQ